MNKSIALKLFIIFLEKNNIKYGILGKICGSGDVDIIVSQPVYKRITGYLKAFCALNQFALVQKIEHENTACFFVIAYFDESEQVYFFLQLDFCYDYLRYGRMYLSGEELLNNLQYKAPDGVWQLNEKYQFIYYLIKKIGKDDFTKKHYEYLRNQWLKARNEIIDLLNDFFSKKLSKDIAHYFDEDNFDSLRKQFPILRNDLKNSHQITLKNRLREGYRIIKRLKNKTGLFVAILGRDGTGKSTLISGLQLNLHPCFRGESVFHLYPGFLVKKGINSNEHADHSTPHASRARNTILSILKLEFYFIEYSLGYWFKLFAKKVSSQLILFDRYFIDILVDPARYRHRGNKWLIWLIHTCTPKPDLWIILDAATDVVFARKKEVTYNESERQRLEYLDLAKRLKNANIVDASASPNAILNDTCRYILNIMSKKL
ncbi:MAG: hypothetical protein M3Z01_00520 [Thermoproteota archaeon]|nr:hypothetical protein [Thermoproteota archaeon]